MEWRSDGILLAKKKHGETSLIIDTFCPKHGRYLGVVKGGTSRKFAPILQVGAQLDLTWRARLQDHLGSFKVELVELKTGEKVSAQAGNKRDAEQNAAKMLLKILKDNQ